MFEFMAHLRVRGRWCPTIGIAVGFHSQMRRTGANHAMSGAAVSAAPLPEMDFLSITPA